MNAFDMARRAYAPAATPTKTPRGIEYDLFSRVTHQMSAAGARGEAGFAALARAVHDNRRMWRTLALDAAAPGNGLPDELRARILYLYEFTRVHSSGVLRREASPDALIEVNTAIMRGLQHEGRS